LAARRAAFQGCLEDAQREVLRLVTNDRFQAAAERAQRFRSAFDAEARSLRMENDLTQFTDGYLFLADLALRAGKREPPSEKEAPSPR
jgi:hypothetical protein